MWPAKKAKRESWRPEAKCKSLLLAALSRTPRDIGTKAGLPGWRCSADRAGLLRNSLLTGNLAGNFTKSGLQDGSHSARNDCAAAISHGIPCAE